MNWCLIFNSKLLTQLKTMSLFYVGSNKEVSWGANESIVEGMFIYCNHKL